MFTGILMRTAARPMPVPEFAGSDILLCDMSGRKTIARGIAGAFGILAVLLLVPVSVSSGRVDLDRDGTFSIAGSYALRGGPALSGEFIKPRGGFDLRLEGGVS